MTDLLSLDDLLKSYSTIPHEQIPQDHPFYMLSQVVRADKIIKITDNIVIDGEHKPTSNSIAVVLDDTNGHPQNLLIHNKNGFLTLNKTISGIKIGKDNGDLFIVDTIQNALDLHIDLNAKNHEHTIIIPPIPSFFNGLVNSFSTKKKVNIFCSINDKDQLLQQFKGKNVRLISLIDPFYTDYLHQYTNFVDFLADKDITAIECGITWGKLGNLRDNVKQTAQPFPIDNFSPIIKNAIIAISEYTQATIEIATMSVLGALTAIAQRKVSGRFTHSTCPVSLFLLTQAESSTGKTACLGLSYYAIDRYIVEAEKKYVIEKEEWQNQLSKTANPAEKIKFLEENPEPMRPDFVNEDATIEALMNKFVVKGHFDLVWQSDDAGVILEGYSFKNDKKQGSVLGVLTTINSKQIATRLRLGGESADKEKKRFCNLTIDLMGQGVILEPILGNPLYTEQGFLARFLFVKSEDNRGYRKWNDPNRLHQSPEQDPRLLDYWQLCDQLLDSLPAHYPRRNIPNQDHRFIIEYDSPAVMQYHLDYQQKCEIAQQTGKLYQFDKEIAGRLAENACRLATIFAFFDQRKTTTIQDYQRAIGIVDFSMNERMRYFKEIQSTQKSEAELMIDWLIKYCKDNNTDQIGQRTFMQKVSPKTPLREKDVFWGNINFLIENNYIAINPAEKMVKINPKLLS